MTAAPQQRSGLRWPRASPRTYLVGTILAATVPLAALVAYLVLADAAAAANSRPALLALAVAAVCPLAGAAGAWWVARRVTAEFETQRRQAEERLCASQRQERATRLEAEAASRVKDEFLAILGHELRNPLNAIATTVEVLNRVGGDPAASAGARSVISRQTRKLAQLIEKLFDVGAVISNDIELLRQPFELAGVAQRVVAASTTAAQARQQQIRTDLAETWIHADVQRVGQIVEQLLDNAIRYAPPGAQIEVRVGTDAQRALLQVSDDGNGLAPELLGHVFEPFVQGTRSLDRRDGGLGVGLTLVRRLAELHGGSVQARNAARGAVFEVRLPLLARPAAAGPGGPEPAARASRVAVIDDNPDAVYALCSMLELDGHRVDAAGDGRLGLALLLKPDPPDIAIVDIGLPLIDGYELARRSRAGGYRGRLVAVSGYGQARAQQRSIEAGFEAHLVKPVDIAELQRLIARE